MTDVSRIALFADTFYEANGAANFLRRLVDFARERDYPYLCVRAGEETKLVRDGSVSFLNLKRSRCSIPLDGSLKYDPFLWKYKKLIGKTLDDFAPDALHVTGINDISQLGFYFAHFKHIPAVASWHTNAHEYAARRLSNLIPQVPSKIKQKFNCAVERASLAGLMKIYFLAQLQLAPNEELVDEIRRLTCRPSFLLGRGVDTEFFSPEHRARTDKTFIIGFVGRLRPEKNVRFLAELDKSLHQAGIKNYKFLIVGGGGERNWLQNNLRNAEFTGEIRGAELSRAYSDMDLFVFPSQTDAFGNVVLEAMAAGVPAVVMTEGGPKFLIEHGKTGYVANGEKDFIETLIRIARNPEQLVAIKLAARDFAEQNSWTSIFEKIYEYYEMCSGFEKKIRA